MPIGFNPLAQEVQRQLKARGYSLGTSGPAGDGIDGFAGNVTFQAMLTELSRTGGLSPTPAPKLIDPKWIAAGRAKLGEKEIPGPKNNGWIANGWAKLGASWFSDDETPWCGFLVAYCLDAAGLPIPAKGAFARALNWATWGTPSTPKLGAIGVKTRKGGGHVFFIVGETPDRQFFKALGGNQGNEVSIVDIPKSSVDAIRWPQGAAPGENILPTLPPGRISASEA